MVTEIDKDNLPLAIICDLDGTLALFSERSPYDTGQALEDRLNNPIANIIEVYDNQKKYDISLILISGREELYREITETWLQKHGVTHYKKLLLRKTGDRRKDFVVKKELYESKVKNKYKVLFVLEDRDQVVKMWRDEGLTCLQVAYGDF